MQQLWTSCLLASYMAVLVLAQDQQNLAEHSAPSSDNSTAKCGNAESDYAPCVSRERGDALFKHCCQQYAPDGCQSLCQYETDELTARNLLLQAVKSGKCELKHMATVLYCASQNQDNRKCCEHLNLSDSKLGVGNRCLRFCDPAGEGITSIARTDVTCLFNWNVLMYCHHSGIKLE
ncbi:DB module domain-containing protein [Ditylenchus destructor]|uniref:DB module domain-containing protein n=1 Tax=Ditylenchus destructor TaxID=166010 RepID=A0AAD4R647_9BILA|nr:DB module domain-containing protein [Ditylenchus destructor]